MWDFCYLLAFEGYAIIGVERSQNDLSEQNFR